MVKLREIPRTATFAWSPCAEDPMLVTGTKAGAIDADFDSTTQLEFWDLNLTDRSADASKLDDSKVKLEITDSRFCDIAWGGQSANLPKGVVAGGHESGKLQLWDVQNVLDGKLEAQHAITKHTGAIKALQWSPVKNHILATAGANGEYYVWDLNKMDSPYKPESSQKSDIDTVAWNKRVPQIIATGASSSGFTTVFDLRAKREVLHLHYPNPATNGRCKVTSVTWNGQSSTELITASGEDQAPVVLSWDLRNSHAPVRTMSGHERGVLSVDWCSNDENLLLSSGMDNRTLLWNPQTGEQLGEYPIATNWSFQASFNNAAPDLLATASFDGKVTVQTLQDTNAPEEAAKKPEGDAFWDPSAYADSQHPVFKKLQAPKWLKRPASAHFGFGGKLVSIKTENGVSSVDISKFVGDEGISEDTAKFAEELNADLGEFAVKKVDVVKNDKDKYDWQVLAALMGQDGSRKDKLAKFFESKEVPVIKEVKSDDNEKEDKEDGDMFGDSTDDFLGEVGVPQYEPEGSFKLFGSEQNDAEKQITRAVLQGQFEKAVDICLKEDRITDAFMLALNASDAVKNKVRNKYVANNAANRPFVRLLNSVTSSNMQDVVANADVSEWREIITGLFTYVEDKKEFSTLAGQLGDRLLEQSGDDSEKRNSAVLCYLAGTNLEKTTQIWLSELGEAEKSSLDEEANTPYVAHVKALHSFIEKVTVFQRAVGTSGQDVEQEKLGHLYDAYREYANIVASHGHLDMAEKYLDMLPSQYPGASLEKERVQKASKKAAAPVKQQHSINAARRGPYAAPVIPAAPVAAPVAAPPQPPHARNDSSAGGSSIYAPQKAAAPVPAPMAQPPMPQANPYQPAPNPYAAAAPNPYQPAQPMAPPGPVGIPPPPRAGGGASPSQPPPPPPKRDESGWNDLPAGAVTTQNRRGTPTASAIRSPFPNAPSNSPPPPVSAPQKGGMPPPPPPRAGSQPQQAPPPLQAASPIQQQQAPSQVNSRYAPQSPAPSNGQLQGGGMAPPPPMGGPPMNRSTPPPQNPYAPSAAQQPPQPPANPYAPAAPRPGVPPPGGNPMQAPPPPPPPGMGAAAPAAGMPPAMMNTPPVQYQAMQQPPPQQQQQQQQQTPPQPEEPPVPAAPPRHPPGDREHISGEARPIFNILSAEVQRVGPLIPQNYARQVRDVEKRLNILFDHLNNDELLQADTVQEVVQLSQAIEAKDYDAAWQMHVDILSAKSEQCAQWMVGVKRLIEMAKATAGQ